MILFFEKAGRILADRRSVGFEIPVDGYDAAPVNGITDYCLFRDNGEVLAVIEAKRIKHDVRVGKEQLLQYLNKIEALGLQCKPKPLALEVRRSWNYSYFACGQLFLLIRFFVFLLLRSNSLK